MTSPDAAAPATLPPLDANGVPDFTVHRQSITFRVDDDVFQAPPTIGGFQLRKLGELHGEFSTITDFLSESARLITIVAEIMKVLIPGPQGRLFAARMMSDGNPGDPEADPPVPPSPKPIGLMDQAMPIMYFMLEKYGLRPTVPSLPSAPGSTDGQTDGRSDGTSSTAGASAAESTT